VPLAIAKQHQQRTDDAGWGLTSSIDGSVIGNQVRLDASALHALKDSQGQRAVHGPPAEHGHQACVQECVMCVKGIAAVVHLHPFEGLEGLVAVAPFVQVREHPTSKTSMHATGLQLDAPALQQLPHDLTPLERATLQHCGQWLTGRQVSKLLGKLQQIKLCWWVLHSLHTI